MKKFTKKQLNKLKTSANKIQPDVVRDRECAGLDKEDIKVYDKMRKIYHKFCGDDLTFQVNFVLPKSRKTICFYRICEPNDINKYSDLFHALNSCAYSFLCVSGFIKWLEKIEKIKILPKGEHKTWAEETKFLE